jgi:integrase
MSVIVRGKNPNKPHTVRYWVDGRQREKSFTTAGQARDFRIKTDHDLRANIFTDPKNGRELFGDYAARWVETYPCADQTRKSLRNTFRKHLAPLHDRTLASIAADHEGITELLRVTIPATAPTVVKRARTIILAVMDLAVVQGKIGGHKLGSITVTAPGRTVKTFTLATRDQLEKIAANLANGFVVLIMHGTGLRIEEALAVNLNNFRENGRTYRATEQVTRDGRGTAPLKHRKRGEYRDVPVPAWLWAMVRQVTPQPDGYLFAGRSARFPTYNVTADGFARHARNAGLPATFTPHSVRHGYASALLAAGVPITDLAQWLGHRNINETYLTYGHLVPSAWAAGRKALEQAWDVPVDLAA